MAPFSLARQLMQAFPSEGRTQECPLGAERAAHFGGGKPILAHELVAMRGRVRVRRPVVVDTIQVHFTWVLYLGTPFDYLHALYLTRTFTEFTPLHFEDK